jgi:pilus assembly protein CpaE
MRKLNILIAGRCREALEFVERTIDGHAGCQTSVRLITNGHTDPLHGIKHMPDLLVLQHTEGGAELKHLSTINAPQRVPLIVFGPPNDAEAVRLAMRAGARDYLAHPIAAEEINNVITEIACEVPQDNGSPDRGSLHVFVNGKGGSGASFLATNVAHGLVSSDHTVTLVDLDLQFAGLCGYLDLEPERGLFEALQAVEDMDEVSARAFTCEHKSGLRLLSAKSESLRLNADMSPERLSSLLDIYRSCNDFVVVDLPRYIDVLSATVLESADRVMVVMQQTLPHIHDTARLLHILRSEIGVDESRITVVVNRHLKGANIRPSDIEKVLGVQNLVTIPNQYKLTAESINAGLPLSEIPGSTSVTKGLRDLHHVMGGTTMEPEQGFLAKALPALLGK